MYYTKEQEITLLYFYTYVKGTMLNEIHAGINVYLYKYQNYLGNDEVE